MEADPTPVFEKQSRNGEDEENDWNLEEDLTYTQVSDPQELHPPSYRINSPQEIRLLAIAENFQRQYLLLHPDRKPLLLWPLNECGVRKFVSTTLQPTRTRHCKLLTWQSCASFVSDFLSLQPLDPPTELPSQLFSSTFVLLSRKASSFEFSSLLCSLLLGLGYDSYCVSGYAVRDMCLQDQSLETCPLLDTEDKVGPAGAAHLHLSSQFEARRQRAQCSEQTENKYTVRRPRELRSRFLLQQEENQTAAEAHRNKLQEEGERWRSTDSLRGLRVHCWVLVLSGSRGVQENFFIDALTGNSYPTDSVAFLGIESVWNHLNYFVNLQDCSAGCAGVVFDLEDLKLWEPVLFGATSRKKLMLEVLESKGSVLDQKHEKPPRVFEMPRSWVRYIAISDNDLEMLYPGGRKVTRYRKAKLEKFSPLVNSNGLLSRLTTYKDLDCSEVATVKEVYKNRNDRLEEKEINQLENFTSERFGPGRAFHLVFHRWKPLSSGTQREMEFSHGREDGLVRTMMSPTEMLEIFEGREDFLYYRHSSFSQVEPSERSKEVLNVLERFHRNLSKPANEDVAERLFLTSQGQMELTYHLKERHFIPSKILFTKLCKKDSFTPDMVSTFQADPSERPPQAQTLLRLLHAMLKEEHEVMLLIYKSMKEKTTMAALREQEEPQPKLLTPNVSAAPALQDKKDRVSSDFSRTDES